MDLKEYRASENEKARVSNLMGLIPNKSTSALDVGARDGFLSIMLTDFFEQVTALDLVEPDIRHGKVIPVKGDITKLDFPNNTFDLVLCAEVLEHIPPNLLVEACSELMRVSGKWLIIGVPYDQDLRVGKTRCLSCNRINPPWAHVNSFNLSRLEGLFSELVVEKVEFVGVSKARTNFISDFFMDMAGNPYGTYSQDESCIYCGNKITVAPRRGVLQKIYTKVAVYINHLYLLFVRPQANWIHVLLRKDSVGV